MTRYLVTDQLPDVADLLRGGHVVLLSRDPLACVGLRRLGLEVRDTLLVLEPGGSRFAFLCRMPCSEPTVAENVQRYGTGGLWIDGCRVGTDTVTVWATKTGESCYGQVVQTNADKCPTTSHTGRWPSNLVLIHTPACRTVGTRDVKAPTINRFVDGMKPFGNGAGHAYQSVEGGTEQVAVWACQEGCPVAALDQQAGMLTSGVGAVRQQPHQTTSMSGSLGGPRGLAEVCYGDSGGASRFFPQFATLSEFESWLSRLLGGPEDK